MRPDELLSQLNSIADVGDEFPGRSAQLMNEWERRTVGLEGVTAVLEFMEGHPDVDYGMPGPLVHFVEKFYGRGYESLLVDSVQRRPTPHTAWMVGRLMNGAKAEEQRRRYAALLDEASSHPMATQKVRDVSSLFQKPDVP